MGGRGGLLGVRGWGGSVGVKWEGMGGHGEEWGGGLGGHVGVVEGAWG